ncbi:hypothetical protein [Mycolicibacterium mucogenicum]|uniref:hypothetical protein n=1 Tax=Mycolicibacterium mucogenicum TaxID=56689 RepID=UPI00076A67BD|nr:hypothetical protein [Mycolicibacterium mucogenicum]
MDAPDPPLWPNAQQLEPETSAPPVVTHAPWDLGLAALEAARGRGSLLGRELAEVLAREQKYTLQLRHSAYADDFDVDELVQIGPAQAILLDPMLTSLTGDALVARVNQILDATRPVPFLREAAPVLIPLTGDIGAVSLLAAGLIPLWIALPVAATLTYIAMNPRRHGAYVRYVRGVGTIVVPPRYPTISLDNALSIAALTPQLWRPAPTSARTGPLDSLARLPSPPDTKAERHNRIAEVHAAVTELDAEWLAYQLDLHAWYFAKPQLRNLNEPATRNYREAQAILRDLADDLSEYSTDAEITAAQDAARCALKAWGAANQHALAIGIGELSPSEEAALHRLNGLVGQLADRATPRSQWQKLVKEITSTMAKLVTVPTTLADIAVLPVIAAEGRLRAIE